MSRYIDADALDRAFSKLRFNNDGELEHYGDRPNWYLWGSEVEDLIANALSIDIVRCGECKLGGTEDCPMDEIDDEYFCNFGEREESE